MKNCLFCQIAEHKLNTDILYEDEQSLVFKDIAPKAPVHLLYIPKAHIESLAKLQSHNGALLSHMMLHLDFIAKSVGKLENGFKTLINTGPEGGQIIPHLHFHILGGGKL